MFLTFFVLIPGIFATRGIKMIIIIVIIPRPMFKVLSSWHAIARVLPVHLMNAERARWLPTFGPSQSAWARDLPVSSYSIYRHHRSLLLLSPITDTHFTIRWRVEGWVDQGGWLYTEMVYLPADSNWARHRVTSLVETSVLSVLTTTPRISISQGSVAKHLRCGGIFNNHLIATLLLSVPAKEFLTSVCIWHNYDKKMVAYFFRPPCIAWACNERCLESLYWTAFVSNSVMCDNIVLFLEFIIYVRKFCLCLKFTALCWFNGSAVDH